MEEEIKELFKIYNVSSVDELVAEFNTGVNEDDDEYLSLDEIIALHIHAKESGDKHNEIGLRIITLEEARKIAESHLFGDYYKVEFFVEARLNFIFLATFSSLDRHRIPLFFMVNKLSGAFSQEYTLPFVDKLIQRY